MRKLLLLALMLSCAGCAAGVKGEKREVDYAEYFQPYHVEGCFILYDGDNDRYEYYNGKRCEQKFLPASTFKIMNSLIALDSGVLSNENQVIKWDGVERQFPVWNQDHDMKTAFKNSTVWYYQEVARRIGHDRMKRYLADAGYGNGDLSAGIDLFWLEGNFRVTPWEQMSFLKRFWNGDLPFRKEVLDTVKRVMIVEETASYRLGAKAGMATGMQPQAGWWVGYVERGKKVYLFVLNIGSSEPGADFGEARIKIARSILHDKGILD